MHNACGMQNIQRNAFHRQIVSILLWLSISTGWLVSIFSVIEELCLATACSDAAVYTFFGVGLAWVGIAYFSLILLLLWQRSRHRRLGQVLNALVVAGIGAEFRLLWIQKFIIGSWCPLCVTISCALFLAALLLAIEEMCAPEPSHGGGTRLLARLAFVLIPGATGFAFAVIGVRALT